MYDNKYGKIQVEKEPGNSFGEDEPVILFRASKTPDSDKGKGIHVEVSV